MFEILQIRNKWITVLVLLLNTVILLQCKKTKYQLVDQKSISESVCETSKAKLVSCHRKDVCYGVGQEDIIHLPMILFDTGPNLYLTEMAYRFRILMRRQNFHSMPNFGFYGYPIINCEWCKISSLNQYINETYDVASGNYVMEPEIFKLMFRLLNKKLQITTQDNWDINTFLQCSLGEEESNGNVEVICDNQQMKLLTKVNDEFQYNPSFFSGSDSPNDNRTLQMVLQDTTETP
ncbi:hypothetical protein SNEBB_006484, partial [Seison nebaliae]